MADLKGCAHWIETINSAGREKRTLVAELDRLVAAGEQALYGTTKGKRRAS